MPPHSSAPVLFLDYDGVLHPDAACRTKQGIVLRAVGHSLFEWAPVLEDVLAPYPSVSIVLSTSWARILGFTRARNKLPPSLRQRVVSGTWHTRKDIREWEQLSRYQQIAGYATRHALPRWIALDDDITEWPDYAAKHLVACDSEQGLGDASTVRRLKAALGALCAIDSPR